MHHFGGASIRLSLARPRVDVNKRKIQAGAQSSMPQARDVEECMRTELLLEPSVSRRKDLQGIRQATTSLPALKTFSLTLHFSTRLKYQD